MANAKTPGQLAYEAELVYAPTYPCGRPRIAWDDLPQYAKKAWEEDPTPRPLRPILPQQWAAPITQERRPYHETPRNIHRDFPKRQMGDI
jgi:hypothetical protein